MKTSSWEFAEWTKKSSPPRMVRPSWPEGSKYSAKVSAY
jgi:hypothetical protein